MSNPYETPNTFSPEAMAWKEGYEAGMREAIAALREAADACTTEQGAWWRRACANELEARLVQKGGG